MNYKRAMAKSLTVDTRDLEKLSRQLSAYKKTAMPYATREYVNAQAFEAQKLWKKELPQKMKLRTKFTERSIQVDKAKSLVVSQQMATVGSVASYMDEQEDGATQSKAGKHGVPIPAASPGRRKKRGKLSKAKQFKVLNVMPRISGHRAKQVAGSLAMAKRRGGIQYAFLKLKKGRAGIYLLDPDNQRRAIRKVWDLSKSSVTIPKNPTMEPAVRQVEAMRPALWRKSLEYQMRRHKLFGY